MFDFTPTILKQNFKFYPILRTKKESFNSFFTFELWEEELQGRRIEKVGR